MIPGGLCTTMMNPSASASGGALLADTNLDVIGPGTGGSCSGTLTIKTDGTLTRSYSGTGASLSLSSGPSNWYTPTTGSIGSSYQARFTPDGSSGGVNTGTLVDSTWTTISANKTIVCASNNTLGGTLEFRWLSDSALYTSGAVNMSADDLR